MVEATLMLGAKEPLAMKLAVAVLAGRPLTVQLVAAFQFPAETLPRQVDEAPNAAVPKPVKKTSGRTLRRVGKRGNKGRAAELTGNFLTKVIDQQAVISMLMRMRGIVVGHRSKPPELEAVPHPI